MRGASGQGLPTSNMLAEIYLADFDKQIRKLKDVAYFRYVDDILILTRKSRITPVKKSVINRLEKLKLLLNEDKTIEGNLQSGFDYLGYKFRTQRITVRTSSKQRFLNSLFKEFIRFKYKKYSEEMLLCEHHLHEDENFQRVIKSLYFKHWVCRKVFCIKYYMRYTSIYFALMIFPLALFIIALIK